jgi:squalene-associated FAD-dependent desaturase
VLAGPASGGAKDVIVIGGGFAGFSAATALAERGARVLIVEARPGLGGRATAFRDPGTGERVDNGQHILMGCYTDTLRFLDRIGAADRVRWQSGLTVAMIDRRGHETVLALPSLPSPLHFLAGVLAWEALSWRERVSVLKIGSVLRDVAAGFSPPITVRQWLQQHGQAPRLCELFWEPLALAALNQSIDQAEASTFIRVVARVLGPDPASAALVLPAVPLDALYVEPSLGYLAERGGEVRVNAPGRIVLDGDRVRGVRVRDELIEAPLVISAVPWFSFNALFDAPPPQLHETLTHAAALGSLPIVTVNLWFDAPVMRDQLIGLPGRNFQWIFDRRAIIGGDASHLSVVSSGAEALVAQSNDTLVATALREVRDALPPARRAALRKGLAVREKRSTFSLAPDAPPRPEMRTPIAGLLLAGDWIQTGLPATIESAVISGHQAAIAAAGGDGARRSPPEGSRAKAGHA